MVLAQFHHSVSLFRFYVTAVLLAFSIASPSNSHAGVWEDIKKVGKKIEKSVNQTGKAIEKGVSQAGKKIEKGANQTGKAIEKGVNQAGKEIEKGANNLGKEIEKGVVNIAKEIEKGGKKLGKGAEHTLNEALDVSNQLIEPVAEALCKLAGAKLGENCSISGGVVVDSNGLVALTDGHGNTVPRPPPPSDTPSVELKTVAVVDPGNDDVVFIGVEPAAAGGGDVAPIPDRVICRGTTCAGVVPAEGAHVPDRSIAFVETTVDLISLSIGIKEWSNLPEDASLREKFEVGGAVLVDATAAVVRFIPGGASLAVSAANRLKKVAKVTTKALDKVPGNWVVKMPRNHDGVKFVKPSDPHTHIRFKLDGSVRAQKHGKALDKAGQPLPTAKSPKAHFTTEEFLDSFPADQL